MTRRTQRFDFKTGQVTEVTTPTDHLSTEERFEALFRMQEKALAEGKEIVVPPTIVCDGCGARQQLAAPRLPLDWVSTPVGEFCPQCQRGE